MYLALARKFRPGDFDHVAGQRHVTQTLANAIKRNKVHHAYLFCGPRGVGKTSIARIFSKSLNCKNGPTPTPCLKCANCIEIAEGRNLAVREIDGASHNSVDNVRDLIDTLKSAPAPGSKYKVYIIDEVHMLSIAAFNALLKSLEEPPANTVFILATTEVHKIPETVISRCQRYDFRALSPDTIAEKLKELSKIEKLDISEEAIAMIARLADGSMRDSQSLLDRVQAYSSDKINAKDVSAALGVVEKSSLLKLSHAVLNKNPATVLSLINDIFSSGIDPRIFLNDFASHWRELLVARYGGEQALVQLGVPESYRKEIEEQAKFFAGVDLQDLVHIARDGSDQAMRSSFPKYYLESIVVRMATREAAHDLVQIINELKSGRTELAATQMHAIKQPISALPNSVSSPAVSPITNQVAIKNNESVITSSLESTKTVVKSSVAAVPGKGLDWRGFVSKASESGSPILIENLKCLKINRLEQGILEATGPKSAIDYLQDLTTQEKLQKLLQQIFPGSAWSIKLQQAKMGELESGSIVADNKRIAREQKLEIIREAEEHPAVANLKKVFPGTTLQKGKI